MKSINQILYRSPTSPVLDNYPLAYVATKVYRPVNNRIWDVVTSVDYQLEAIILSSPATFDLPR